jgi:hypothetical protein
MKPSLAGLLIVAIAGCASMSKPTSSDGGQFRRRNEGYSLLYKLVSDDSDVDKIFIIKHADDSVVSIVKEIAALMQSSRKQLEDFRRNDAQLRFDVTDLPVVEQQSRELEADDQRNGLLFSGGATFQLRLIFAQLEAVSYGKQLAKTLLKDEDDPARKKFLTNFSQRCDAFHERLMSLLSVKTGAA